MIENKDQLFKRGTEILSQKSFAPKAKAHLLHSILFAYEHYDPPKYITQSRSDYIEKYLSVLGDLKACGVVELSEINDQNEASVYFRSRIRKSSRKPGNLELINGNYVPMQEGSYECSCVGFARVQNKEIFMLDEGDLKDAIATIHHEMTHLSQGSLSFLIPSFVPFSSEIRLMLFEGRAGIHEHYIHATEDLMYREIIKDKSTSYQINSVSPYPLYGNLYQLLQIIFGDEILEEMSKNDRDINVIEVLKVRYPQVPVEEIFANIIYILSCQSKEKENENKHEILASAIRTFANVKAKETEWIVREKAKEEHCLEANTRSLMDLKKEELEIIHLLENPELLKSEYESALMKSRKMIETIYQGGFYTKAEYMKELESLETEATLEYFLETKKCDLQNNKIDQESKKKEIENSAEKIRTWNQKIQMSFPMILERVCLKEASLTRSFSYLEQISYQILREEWNSKTNPQMDEALLDKMRIWNELKENTILITPQQKNSNLKI